MMQSVEALHFVWPACTARDARDGSHLGLMLPIKHCNPQSKMRIGSRGFCKESSILRYYMIILFVRPRGVRLPLSIDELIVPATGFESEDKALLLSLTDCRSGCDSILLFETFGCFKIEFFEL